MLKRYIAIDDSPENIANHLITKTVEIEEVKTRSIPESIVIGKITKVEKHPDADKLNVCMVDCGSKGEFQIVCGGSNVKEGLFVPTALAGTYFAEPDLTIAPRKMRGVESNGMICAKVELGIKEDLDTHGIWDMEQDFDDLSDEDLGKAVVEKYEWLENTVLDADNKGLTHRPDLTGHFGIGTELQAIYKYHHPELIKFDSLNNYFELFKTSDIFQVLEGSEKSNRNIVCETEYLNSYIALEIKDVCVKQSDFFTRLEMLDAESNPINNWVDFSNLFMQSTGQPIHFFDAEKIKGDIVIRQARDGEKFVDLFEKEHTLQPGDIVIADSEKVLALWGIVGGLESWVTDSTKNIVAEIANFDPVAVRKTGVRLGLRTDAELRFEKEINPLYSLQVLHFFLDQLTFYKKDLGNFELKGLNYYVKNSVWNTAGTNISIDPKITSQFIYGEAKENFAEDVSKALQGLGFGVRKEWEHGEKLTIQVPVWRSPADITIPADVYEEVARIIGYDSIATKDLMQTMDTTNYPWDVALVRNIEETLVKTRNYDQIETYPWIWEKQCELFAVEKDNLYRLQNPIDVQFPYLRDSMVYGLLQAIGKNGKFFDEIKIFDIGRIWNKSAEILGDKTESTSKYAIDSVGEQLTLGMMSYKSKVSDWKEDTLLACKTDVQSILDALNLSGKLEYQATEHSFAHPKKQGTIFFNRQVIGSIYTLHPSIFGAYKINDESMITYVELNLAKLEALKNQSKTKTKTYETLQDQIIWRDLCFVVDSDQDFSGIINGATAIREVEAIEIFDLYEGEHLPEWKKSCAFKFKIRGENLKTEEINEIMQKVIEKVEKSWASLR